MTKITILPGMGIVRAILFMPLSLSWQLLNQFLLSPWGLIVPMALLIALGAFHLLQKTPGQLARYYAGQLETCDESDLPRLLQTLVQMEDAGVPGLVQGLTSHRESVFAACRRVLQHEFDRWQESPRREHHFRVLSEAILQMCSQFSPAGQVEALRFVDQMMQIRPDAATSPESTANRQQMIAHCERILAELESQRRRRIEPASPEFEPHNSTVASLDRRARQPMLLASNGQPFVPTSVRQDRDAALLADADSFNPFSVPRAERLMAYQKAQQNRPSEGDDQHVMELAHSSFPPAFAAEAEQRFAQHFASPELASSPLSDISEEYRNRRLAESGRVVRSGDFLTPELRNMPLNRVHELLTTQLMQLLHHPDPSYVDAAREMLMSRDGFQEVHLKLAWRLYHPVPAVREEIVAMLPNTANIQASVWLKELLNDPNNDVRYRTASFLATTSDPALRQLLIDKGKRDTDARIVNLADRLNDSQGNVRR